MEILALLAKGYTNRQIAQELILSQETIKWYNRQLYSKLGVHNRLQASLRAREVGLLDEGKPATSGVPTHHLPTEQTSFVGREQELTKLTRRLTDPTCRLLTLTGPGGIGKTRLALEVAARLLAAEHFPGGAYFVPLAGVPSAAYLVSSMTERLGLSLQRGSDPQEQLLQSLAGRRQPTLLVLDNFEHLVSRAELVTAILQAAPVVKLLVTSRERLNLRDEWLLDLRGLPFPEPVQGRTSTLIERFDEAETRYGAVQLFMQRVRQVDADFDVTKNAAAVIRICQLVEGMPLGLELAAAWARVLPCAEIAREVEANLKFLSTSHRDVPRRQRSLTAIFDQSWRNLTAQEQRTLRGLSVFRGGFSREAAEQVSGASLSLLLALIDKSMLRRSASQRFELHELLRQFGAEKLADAGETELIRDRHLAHFVQLAEHAEPQVWGPAPDVWLDRLELERDNMRAALQWSRSAQGRTESGLRLAAALAAFWYSRSYFKEGREYLTTLLSKPDARERTAARARALNKAGFLAHIQSDYPSARPLLEESLSIYRSLGPAGRRGVASVLIRLGDLATEVGHYEAAAAWSTESLHIAHELEDARAIARAYWQLGLVAVRSGDYERAAQDLEDVVPLWRQIGDVLSTASVLSLLAEVKIRQGDYQRAAALEEESLALRQKAGDNWGTSVSLGNLAWIAMSQGDRQHASTLLFESFTRRRELGDKGGMAWCLEKWAEIAWIQAQGESAARRQQLLQKAVRLFGAAASLRASVGAANDRSDQREQERQCAAIRTELGERAYTTAWEEGPSLSLEQLVGVALGT